MKRRIAYICADPGVPVFGRKGCSIHVQEVIRALQDRGIDIDLFAVRIDSDPPADLKTVRVHRLAAPAGKDLASREQGALAANEGLIAALRAEGPFDALYERHSLWSFGAMEYARQAGCPSLLEVNAPLIQEQAAHRGLIDRAGAEAAAHRAFNAAGALIAVSEVIATYLNKHLADEGRVHVISNGVDVTRFPANLKPSLPAEPGGFTVGFVGTMRPWHGLHVLIDAFASLHSEAPNSRLLLVGEGQERASIEADVIARGLRDAVHFTGSVHRDEIPALLASMDVGVAPYPAGQDFYFSPLKVFEYMAAGLPVVASRVGQLAELIRDGENGILCPAGDAMGLASALCTLRNDVTLRARTGRKAREDVLLKHTWSAVVGRILRLLDPQREARLTASSLVPTPEAVLCAGNGVARG